MNIFAQEQKTIYYNNAGDAVSKDSAAYFKSYNILPSGIVAERSFYLNKKLRSIDYFKSSKRLYRIDTSFGFYENGFLDYQIYYDDNGLKTGLEQYHITGELKRVEFYENGRFIKGKKFDINGNRVAFKKFAQEPIY